VTGVCTDSRNVRAGDLFFALPGEHADGHAFVGDALRQGAVAAIVSRPDIVSDLPTRGVVILVDDTVKALGRLGAFHRRQLAAQVIAVTGSNGKTSTKMMIDHILGGRMHGRAAVKSFNNEIGVPLTLLSAERGDEYLVVEIGTNAPGEVSQLGAMTLPDIALITSISESHLAGLGDVDGVATEKLSLLRHLKPGGCAVVNTDYEVVRRLLSQETGPRLLTFGSGDGADLRLTEIRTEKEGIWFQVNGRLEVRLPVLGRHNAMNAVGAMAVARRLGLTHEEIAERLATFALPAMRLQRVDCGGGVTVINDAYNANPASMREALQVLADFPARGKRICVLGDMLELGDRSADLHRQLGEQVGESNVSLAICVGEHAKAMAQAAKRVRSTLKTRCHQNSSLAAKAIRSLVKRGDVVLVKGSRGVQMERVVEALLRRGGKKTSTLAA
jgi:UDP-N-acetylmuramoyl-tripeptide--D-alanyl-D-alanine ligase